jgi:hypothetical protein
VFPLVCFLIPGRWIESENPISQKVIHHRQNPIVTTSFILVFFFDNPSTLKMEAMCSLEASVDFQLTRRSYISLKNGILHNRRTWILNLFGTLADGVTYCFTHGKGSSQNVP